MANYIKTTDFAAKDSLPSGDTGKIIRGSEFETEFDNIETAIATKADSLDAVLTGSTSATNLSVSSNTTLNNATVSGDLTVDTMRFEPRATAPSSPSAGDIFFNSTLDTLEFYNGITWVNAGNEKSLITITTTSTSKTLSTGERCYVDTSGQTITLPSSPSTGDIVGVVVGDFTDTIVARNGSTIMDLAEDLTIDASFASIDFQYIDSTWRLV